jgi:Mn-dependent DtxR family transcriptional regulator
MATVSHSAAHYLMAISDLVAEKGQARCSDIAARLNITRGAALLGLKNLQKKGLIQRDEKQRYHLPETSLQLACHVRGNHTLLYRFFKEVLHLSSEESETSACRMAHLLSEEAALRLSAILKHLDAHPLDLQPILRQIDRQECKEDCRCDLCSTFHKRRH